MSNDKEQKDLEAMIARDEKAAAELGISVDRYHQLCDEWNHLHDDGWDVPEREYWLKEVVEEEMAKEADDYNPETEWLHKPFGKTKIKKNAIMQC